MVATGYAPVTPFKGVILFHHTTENKEMASFFGLKMLTLLRVCNLLNLSYKIYINIDMQKLLAIFHIFYTQINQTHKYE